jgi:NIPSNAP
MNRRALLKSASAAAILPLITGATMSAAADTDETVYELRIYHLNEGKLPLILDRFRTKETAIFVRHGMHPLAYWTPIEGEIPPNTLVYMLRHESREAARANWAAFSKDPEWVALKAETEKDGPFVAKYDITFLKLTEFSPKL